MGIPKMRGGTGQTRITLKQVSARKKNIAIDRSAKSRMGGGGPGGGAFASAYKTARSSGLSKRIARQAGHAAGAKISPSFMGKVKVFAKGRAKRKGGSAADYVGSVKLAAKYR